MIEKFLSYTYDSGYIRLYGCVAAALLAASAAASASIVRCCSSPLPCFAARAARSFSL